MAGVVPDDTDVLDDEVLDRLIGLKFDPELLRALWERSDLPFPQKLAIDRHLCNFAF
jgi:putative transposase